MRRALLALGILALALLAADRVLGWRMREGTFQGIVVPPYGFPDPQTVEALQRRLRQLDGPRPRRPYPLRVWSQRYGWVNVPGECEIDDVRYVVSSLGARGPREVREQPPAGTLRVLCFGESFTYGTEVADGEDWPTVLDDLEPRLEVLNFGVGAWGTDQALLRFREVAPDLHGDVVVLGLLLENICRNVNRYRQMYQPRDALALVKPRFRLADGALELLEIPYPDEVAFLRDAAAGRLRDVLREGEWWAGDDPAFPWSNMSRAFAARRALVRRRPSLLWSRPDEEPYQVTVALLEAFHREALALGARCAPVVLFQSRADHEDVANAGTGPYWTGLCDDLDRRGVPWIDTYPLIAARLERGLPTYLDTHHTPDANREIAELVRGWLAERLDELR